MTADAPLWRVFPWDQGAAPGAPYSASFVPPRQGAGRFDLPDAAVLYLAESPEHAVAERIQGWRGQQLEPFDLTDGVHPLALVAVTLPASVGAALADCCDPAVLVQLGVRPDELASRDLARTRAIALVIGERGHTGLRWWSSLGGDWHTVVLFMDRVETAGLTWGEPERLTVEHVTVEAACALLGIPRAKGRRRRP